MNRHSAIFIFLSVALWLCTSSISQASDGGVTIKMPIEARVTGDTITIGEIAKLSGPLPNELSAIGALVVGEFSHGRQSDTDISGAPLKKC